MQLTIAIKLDDAAFRDPGETGEEDSFADGSAVAAVLREIAENLDGADLWPGTSKAVRNPWSTGGPIGSLEIIGDELQGKPDMASSRHCSGRTGAGCELATLPTLPAASHAG